MKVINIVGNKYTVLNLVTLKEEEVHVTSLKAFGWDARKDPRDIALKESGSYDVEKIIEHRCKDKNKIATYEFKVRWLGYTEQDDTWEPWNGIKNVEATHQYLKDNGLKKFIPIRFKD